MSGVFMVDQAIFGGGCFWCMEPVFRALRGVQDVQAGYCGGRLDEPTYEQVCGEETGHVECIRVTYDPEQVSYRTLCEVFFGTHDPTTVDRQGHDVGAQYASVIFYLNDEQHLRAVSARDEAQASFEAPICTRIAPAVKFWPAEDYHQRYYQRNPEQGYCRFVIAPKMAKFLKRYPTLLRDS
ncbi:Peptide methionine sulfoxide reductase MsrA OS=Castellaniella defragrans OX=75697 GN=msrA PE=3 SV=1 [Castellaniella defragrans]